MVRSLNWLEFHFLVNFSLKDIMNMSPVTSGISCCLLLLDSFEIGNSFSIFMSTCCGWLNLRRPDNAWTGNTLFLGHPFYMLTLMSLGPDVYCKCFFFDMLMSDSFSLLYSSHSHGSAFYSDFGEGTQILKGNCSTICSTIYSLSKRPSEGSTCPSSSS